jgi:hypothetical protein
MTLVLSAAVPAGDDLGKKDVRETHLAFVRASTPATDASKLLKTLILIC